MGAKTVTDFGRRSGDMLKSVYDSNKDGVVDDSKKLEGETLAQVQDHTPKSHTHTEAQITDLDHDALKIKGVIVNDAAIGDQKVLAYDLGTERLIYISQAPSGAALNSIQAGVISIYGSAQTSETYTINAVDVDKSILIYGGRRSNLAPPQYNMGRIEITDSTTVTVTIGVGYDNYTYFSFSVIEFSSGIKSIQQGTITMTDQEETDTIDAVDTDKAFVIYLGASTTIDEKGRDICTLELTNSTTVTCKNTQVNASCVVGYMVVEFD